MQGFGVVQSPGTKLKQSTPASTLPACFWKIAQLLGEAVQNMDSNPTILGGGGGGGQEGGMCRDFRLKHNRLQNEKGLQVCPLKPSEALNPGPRREVNGQLTKASTCFWYPKC